MTSQIIFSVRSFMFYQFFKNEIREVSPDALDPSAFTAGYIRVEDLPELNRLLGFDESTVRACQKTDTAFRSGVEVHSSYTYTQLRILNRDTEADDYIALYVRKNLILVVDIRDEDGSTKEKYLSAMNRYPPAKICCEKMLAAFLDSLIAGDYSVLENFADVLSEEEDALQEKEPEKDYNIRLMKIKKLLSRRHTYYAQLLDITEAVSSNDNEIFEESRLIYVDNVSKHISRLREDTADLKNDVEHLQDAYSSMLDIRMNSTMKIFTVLTSIFFPLTIIVGWYGMNFQHMPEFAWKYGYVYVILLSVVTVLVFAVIGKRKKWF